MPTESLGRLLSTLNQHRLRCTQILGNTFPSMVFTTLGGFWLVLAINNDPSVGIIASYSTSGNPAEGAASPAYNAGNAIYLVCWGILIFM